MANTFEVKIEIERLPLSDGAARALRNLDRYDLVVLTSKNAWRFLLQELHQRKIPLPLKRRVVIVGPRRDLLKLRVRGKRILFPRSAMAPYDIVHDLRGKGAIVRPVPLYTARGARLARSEKKAILSGGVAQLRFRSPSGVWGLMRQFRGKERLIARAIPASCIGETTARAARAAGFKKVTVGGIL